MSRIFLGLSSREGDRLGHLVRGVQMLRSYGHEADIEGYSDVVSLVLQAEEEPSFACVLSGESGATFEALQGICRETEWALGKQPETLTVWILQHGERRPGKAPRAFVPIARAPISEGVNRQRKRGAAISSHNIGRRQSFSPLASHSFRTAHCL